MKILRHISGRSLSFNLVYAGSRREALTLLNQSNDWLAAIVDLNLPDAPHGELVDDMLSLGIPTIVLTGSVDEEKRESLTRKGIVDYVLKEGRQLSICRELGESSVSKSKNQSVGGRRFTGYP